MVAIATIATHDPVDALWQPAVVSSSHNDKVLEQFRLQASTFTDTGFATSGLAWIVEQLAPRPGEQALDVAAGAGHLGRALAPHLAQVSAVDLTPEMLEQGDRLARALSYIGYGMPSFFAGSILILVFAVRLHWLGAEGPQSPGIAGVLTDWRDLTLPVLTLAVITVAIFTRYVRSAAIDSLGHDYVRTARAAGAGQARVLSRHVLRNSLIPVITLAGLSIPRILAGSLVVESLFNIQGMGWRLWQAALKHDFPVLLGFILVIGVGAVVGSLLADIGYAAADPRVRYGRL